MQNATQQPFFVRYLEGQDFPVVQTDVKAGAWPPAVTMKWPSDGDDNPPTVDV